MKVQKLIPKGQALKVQNCGVKTIFMTPRAKENKKTNIKNKNVGEGRQFLWTPRPAGLGANPVTCGASELGW